jgi:hypothetical protein
MALMAALAVAAANIPPVQAREELETRRTFLHPKAVTGEMELLLLLQTERREEAVEHLLLEEML